MDDTALLSSSPSICYGLRRVATGFRIPRLGPYVDVGEAMSANPSRTKTFATMIASWNRFAPLSEIIPHGKNKLILNHSDRLRAMVSIPNH